MFYFRTYHRLCRSVAYRFHSSREFCFTNNVFAYDNTFSQSEYYRSKILKCKKISASSETFCSISTSKGISSAPAGDKELDPEKNKLSYRSQLKRAVKEYGATVIVFHVAISLASLGTCYLAVSNGLDVSWLISFIGFSEEVVTNTFVAGGSTMVISYAVHKLFAPLRILTTVTATPFIVRYLRKIGFLKLKNVPKS